MNVDGAVVPDDPLEKVLDTALDDGMDGPPKKDKKPKRPKKVKPDKKERTPFLKRVRTFFGFTDKKNIRVSRFAHLLDSMDRRDADYLRARTVAELCDEALDVVNQRLSSADAMRDAEKVLVELNYYEGMSDEDAKELGILLARLKGLTRDKDELRGQISAFDPNLARMAELEDAAEAIAPEMKDAEQRQRMFRHDIHALRGEKSELELEREDLVRGERVVRQFMTGVLVFFVVCVAVIGVSGVAMGAAFAIPISILTILAIVVTSLLIGYRRRLTHELALNLKKQQKAVGLLNKKNANFAHYTNFLNFTYKKYRVRSSDMLRKRLKEYDHYRHLTRRYDALRKLGDETERDLNRALNRLKIPVSILPLDNFARMFNLDEKRDMYKNAVQRKATTEKKLHMLDERQASLWDQITSLNPQASGVVDQIIKLFIEESGRLILNQANITAMQPEPEEDEAEMQTAEA